MKILKTLQDHNNAVLQGIAYGVTDEPKPNGIECPICKSELLDSNPSITLTSYPAKKNVHCASCGYAGYRYI